MSHSTLTLSNDDHSNKTPEKKKNDNDPFRQLESISVDEVGFDQPPATRAELWSYYNYYNGVRSYIK